MVLDVHYFKMMLLSSCDILEENLESLSEIDSKFGDGNHGITMVKITKTIRDVVGGWPEGGLRQMLETIGSEVIEDNGGAAGILWGSFFQGLSEAMEDQEEIDENLLKDMLLAALINMQMITPARLGDKTMMDVLIPVVNGSRACLGAMEEVLEAIEASAVRGAEETKSYPAKFGKAGRYGEEAVGYIDPGALGMSLFFQGWNNIVFDY